MGQASHYTSANLGGVKRGDSDETGDLEARPEQHVGRPEADNDLDDLTVMDADDPALGLTNIGEVPPGDWAADTGPTHSGEADAPSGKR